MANDGANPNESPQIRKEGVDEKPKGWWEGEKESRRAAYYLRIYFWDAEKHVTSGAGCRRTKNGPAEIRPKNHELIK